MRRANGTGSVVKLSGNRRKPWAVRVPALDDKGRPRQKYLSYHRTAAEAQVALDEWIHSPGSTVPAAHRQGLSTLADVYQIYCSSNLPKLSVALQRSYRAAWNKRLCALGPRKFADLRVEDFQQLLDRSAKDGLSQSSLVNMRSLIKHLYGIAYQRYITDRDLSAYLYTPDVPAKAPRRALTSAELDKIRRMAAKGDEAARIALILCYTGLRISELLAMNLSDYHREPVPYLVGGLKTKAGKNRVIPVHSKIQTLIDLYADRHGVALICDPDGRRYTYQQAYSDFCALAEQLHIEHATPHWCRHTFLSWAKYYGMDELARRRIAGHADRDTTDHYTHLPPEYLAAELEKIQ